MSFREGSNDGTISSGGGYTELVASPGATARRVVKNINVYNPDELNSVTVGLYYKSGSNYRFICKETLSPADTLVLGEEDLQVLDATNKSIVACLFTPYPTTVPDFVTGYADSDSVTAALQTSPLSVKGDLLGFNTAAARVPVGTDGYGLRADSNQTLGVAWMPHYLGMKNAIINGAMDIWQRGTSFAAAADASYFADRFRYNKVGAMVHTLSRDTDVPTLAQAGILANYSLKVDCTTVDSSIASTDLARVYQSIEGYNWKSLAQKQVTLSFWVKATKTGVYCVALRNSAADRTYVAEYTVLVTDTWEKKTITISASPSGGTWDYTNGVGLAVVWTLAAGSNFQTTAEAWQSGAYLSTSNQVNACDSTSNYFRLALVQLEAGGIATDFEPRAFGQELALCQRYYEKSYAYATALATATAAGGVCHASGPNSAGSVFMEIPANFRVSKRVSPTVSYWDWNGNASKVTELDAGASQFHNVAAAFGPINIGDGQMLFGHNIAASRVGFAFQWAADAEL
ncbi:MAG: hypothetical protein K2R98_19495 [Gemmataceae bacterium]|nr:hypothetical protein [Gemmataceae bacterium]